MTTDGVERPRPHDESHNSAGRQSATNGDHRQGYGPPHPLEGIFKHVRELVEYANFYVETRKDIARATIRSLIWKVALGLVAAVAGLTVIIMAGIYLMSGIAHGLGRLLGDEFWLGELVTAVAVFLLLTIAGWISVKSMNRKARERTVEKYARRQKQQRQQFGRSATERAQQIQPTHRS